MDSKKPREKSPPRPPDDGRRHMSMSKSMKRKMKRLQYDRSNNNQGDNRNEGSNKNSTRRQKSRYNFSRHRDYYPNDLGRKDDYQSDRYNWGRRSKNNRKSNWNSKSSSYDNLSWSRHKSSNPFKDHAENIVNPSSVPYWFDNVPSFHEPDCQRDNFSEDFQIRNETRKSRTNLEKSVERVSPVRQTKTSNSQSFVEEVSFEEPNKNKEKGSPERRTDSRIEEPPNVVSVKLENPNDDQSTLQTNEPWNEYFDCLIVSDIVKEEPTCANSSEEQEPFRGFSNEPPQSDFGPLAHATPPPSVLEEPTDSDVELANCLNVNRDSNFPSISLIPISRLIKSELQDLNKIDIVAPTTPSRSRPTLRPNLVQRRKKSINDDNSSSLSENLVQRVANMDKIGIKNVINNSGTKYDAALKIQARKRLREEIRKQLKTMNFTPTENSENNVLVPDEIVDSMNIPAVVLDEIRKAFGIVLVEDMKVVNEPKKTSNPTISRDKTQPAEDSSSKSPDLMTRLKMLEETKSQTEKVSSIRRSSTSKKRAKSKEKDDVVVINSSSSSSSSSSSESDTDSSSSSSSTSSSFKRRKRKKDALEANVVENFEKLILPNLSESQRRRYKQKYSKNVKNSLMYIYGVCVSRASRCSNTLDPKEKVKIKHNLSSSDNAEALEFLMTAILNLFEQHKEEKRQKDKEKEAQPAAKPGSSNKRSNPISSSKKSKDFTHNQDNPIDEQAEQTDKTASTAKTHQTSSKVDEVPSLQPPPVTAASGVNRNDEDSIMESAKSAQGVSTGGDSDMPATSNKQSDSESDLDDLPGNNDNPPPQRQWRSPGEKKCIETEASTAPLSDVGMMQMPFGMTSLDLCALKSHNSIGDEAVNNIREIDVKLMELHKRKMYIEEMILKLHKDKMEVDLCTMKLQNEKFILLNAALANASTNNSAAGSSEAEKKSKSSEKRKIASPSSAEKPQQRKKHCPAQPPADAVDTSKIKKDHRKTRRTETTASTEKKTASGARVKTEAPAVDEETTQAPEPEPEPESEKTIEIPQVDYTDVPNGHFEGWKLPITQINVVGEAIVAASEDGNIYKFNIRTRELESKFSKHTEAITQIFACPREKFVYTTSLDGYLKKTLVENFGLEIQSLNLQEPLQSIDIEWGTAFIGSRWGNIFTYDIKSNNLSESLLCSSGSSIIAIKATKEGPRKILIVSSKGNQINFRDALTGLLLRSLDVPENIHIYSILLDGGCVFCGTQRNEIHKYNFTTGGIVSIFRCGNGAVSMKLYKDRYIFVGCYDGFVYVLDKATGCQIGRFPGSGKMILALEIAGDKIITSAKDNTMHIMDIPKYIVTRDKN